jgi:REP element-mobilizing transposase RayT
VRVFVVQASKPALIALGRLESLQHKRGVMEFIDPRQTPFVPLKTRGELPHLHKPGGCYFVTFRLWDAIMPKSERVGPKRIVEDYAPADLLREFDPPLTLGSCALSVLEVATMVQSTLRHFDGERYALVAWCLMPNHVHVILTPFTGQLLSEILRSWKGYSARQANQLLDRTGPFWEREYFDHLIRTADEVERFARYVEDNPVEARLCATPSDWPYSSAGVHFESPLGRR